jgi:hypothetical protein
MNGSVITPVVAIPLDPRAKSTDFIKTLVKRRFATRIVDSCSTSGTDCAAHRQIVKISSRVEMNSTGDRHRSSQKRALTLTLITI